MNWKIDYLIIGFILQNVFILILGLKGYITANWIILMILPLGIWGIELLRFNLSKQGENSA